MPNDGPSTVSLIVDGREYFFFLEAHPVEAGYVKLKGGGYTRARRPAGWFSLPDRVGKVHFDDLLIAASQVKTIRLAGTRCAKIQAIEALGSRERLRSRLLQRKYTEELFSCGALTGGRKFSDAQLSESWVLSTTTRKTRRLRSGYTTIVVDFENLSETEPVNPEPLKIWKLKSENTPLHRQRGIPGPSVCDLTSPDMERVHRNQPSHCCGCGRLLDQPDDPKDAWLCPSPSGRSTGGRCDLKFKGRVNRLLDRIFGDFRRFPNWSAYDHEKPAFYPLVDTLGKSWVEAVHLSQIRYSEREAFSIMLRASVKGRSPKVVYLCLCGKFVNVLRAK